MIKRKQRGVSILEIVVSMVILMLALSAMAFVYPQGRKVTDKSDKRTKATEIARSILEETQGLRFVAGSSAASNPDISDVGLVGNSSTALGKIISPTGQGLSFCTAKQWPYHHYSSSSMANWALKMPCFISEAQNSATLISEFKNASDMKLTNFTDKARNVSKQFALLTKGIDTYTFNGKTSSIPRFIIVSPDSFDIISQQANTTKHGTMATLQSCVVWMDYIAKEPHLDCVILTSGVSSNRYTGGVEN